MKKIDLASVKGAGIRIADQNHYDYSDFMEWLEQMGKPIRRMIEKDPKSIPYIPEYRIPSEMMGQWKIYPFDSKQEMVNTAKRWFYLWGVESVYTYKKLSRARGKYFAFPNYLKSSNEWYHPITFQFWTGTKPKRSN